jgi:hypothetical protein
MQAATLSQPRGREKEESSAASMPFDCREKKAFPGRPRVIVRLISSVARTSSEDIDANSKCYYLISPFLDYLSLSQPYELKTIDRLSEFERADDIVTSYLAHPLGKLNPAFVQTLGSEKRGRFLASPIGPSSAEFLEPQCKSEEFEVDSDSDAEDEMLLKGIFVIPYKRKILFRKRIRIEVSKLPRKKPNIVVDSYRSEDDDDE